MKKPKPNLMLPTYGVNYLKLAEQYASFLIALGGVNITVLALVLAIREQVNTNEKIKSHLYFHIVASLTVATLSCFVGAHLMAETASFTITNTQKDYSHFILIGANVQTSLITYRLFLIASITIYISAIFFVFSLTLLPAIYLYPIRNPQKEIIEQKETIEQKITIEQKGTREQKIIIEQKETIERARPQQSVRSLGERKNDRTEQPQRKKNKDRISTFTSIGFVFVVVGAWYWMYRSPLVLSDGDKLIWKECFWITFIIGLLYAFFFLTLKPTNNQLPLFPYLLMTVFIVFTLSYFAFIYDNGGRTSHFDLQFFCISVSLCCVLSLELGFRTLLSLRKCKFWLVSKTQNTKLRELRKYVIKFTDYVTRLRDSLFNKIS